MFSQEDKEFIDFLFDKLSKHVDTDMLDLQDDDSCCDHIQLSLLEVWHKVLYRHVIHSQFVSMLH